jgi:hypothetical protein
MVCGSKLIVLVAAMLGSAGCVTYTRVSPAEVGPSEEVRVRVTTAAAVRVGGALGSIRENLEGQLVPQEGADSLRLSVWVGRDYPGTPFADAHQDIFLGPGDILEVRRRQVSIARTGIAAAGVLALTAILVDRIVLQEDPNPGGPGRPGAPPPSDRLTIRIPLGWIR